MAATTSTTFSKNDLSSQVGMNNGSKKPLSIDTNFLSNQSAKIVKYEMFNPSVMLLLLKHDGIGLATRSG